MSRGIMTQAQLDNEILAEQMVATMPAAVRAEYLRALHCNLPDYAAAIIVAWHLDTLDAIDAACRLPAEVAG